MAIGAVLASIRAIFHLVHALAYGRAPERAVSLQALVTLAAGGAAAGALFTALRPLRRRAAWGQYLSWILTVYALLAVVVGVGVWQGDDPDLLREPAVLAFLLGSGAAAGAFCARLERRWATRDVAAGRGLSPQERERRDRFDAASWFFVAVFIVLNLVTRGSVDTIPFTIMMVSFLGFLVTKSIATSPSSIPRTLLALLAVGAGLAAGTWVLVGVKVTESGRATGFWFGIPFLVLCGLVGVGCLVGAAALVRD